MTAIAPAAADCFHVLRRRGDPVSAAECSLMFPPPSHVIADAQKVTHSNLFH
jgi:hypothetical protein